MLRNHKLAKAISDASWGLLKTLLISKCAVYEVILQPVGRSYASSQLCSGCKHKKTDLSLADRTYKCSECGLEIDRDLNAALNIEAEAKRLASIS